MSPKKIGYLGPEGTFSQEAGDLYRSKLEDKGDLIPFATIHDVLFAADSGTIDEAVVPVENSIEGTVGIVNDMLVKDVDLRIRGELILPVRPVLMANENIALDDITEVISHPQPIEQCRGWIRKNLMNAKVTLSYSTADAAKIVALSGKPHIGAIGPKAAAHLYRLKVLAEDVMDYADNSTRFLVLSKEDHPRTGSDKTSIIFSAAADQPGGLHKILGVFADRDINLTKIESRPSKKALGDYFFFVDMQGHKDDKKISEALEDIKDKVAFIKLLGSYPKA